MIIPALERRGAVKFFDPKASLEKQLLETILEAGRLAPSAFGLQPHRMLVLTEKDADKRAQILSACYQQPQITDASVLIVGQSWTTVSAQDIERYMNDICQQRQVSRQDLQPFYDTLAAHFLQMPSETFFQWSSRQAYISLGMMLTAAAVENVGSSPMEGFNPLELDRILETPEKYKSVFILALGYRAQHDERSRWPRVRRSMPDWAQRPE